MKKKDIIFLLHQYINGEATPEECSRLFAALDRENNSAEWEQVIRELIEQQTADPGYKATRWESVITHILAQDDTASPESGNPFEKAAGNKTTGKFGRRQKRIKRQRFAIAATIMLILGLGVWYSLQRSTHEQLIIASDSKEIKGDIPPGGNKAVLTLANGKTIVLDSMKSGLLSVQGRTKVIKVKSGLLSYETRSKKDRANNIFNTITTPRGGQYEVILPDGSKVWLNAASSIRFPTVFTGKNRRVFIKGEAYFEVTKNEKKPFIVSANDVQVKVFGTAFNIMAYRNEPAIKTTLVEGSVKVAVDSGKQSAILRPGQNASILYGTKKIDIVKADIEEITAWKNGLFQFSDTDIAMIMRQVARWYDVEVVYKNGVPPGHITGKIPRNTSLSNIMKIMELSGVNFKIEDRRVIILNG